MASNYVDKDRLRQKQILIIVCSVAAILILVYICARAAWYAADADADGTTIAHLMAALMMQGNPLDLNFSPKYFVPFAVPVTLVCGFMVFGACDTQVRDKHKLHGTEQGTAKFMDTKMLDMYNMKYTYPEGSKETDKGPKSEQNIILTKNGRVGFGKLGNDNILVIGGPGTGKSWAVVRPNILQEYGSYVITDPSGELLATCGNFLIERGYQIRVLNLVDMAHSNTYNPFRYIEKEEDVMTLINCLINCTSDGQKSSDPFWEKSETALLEAIIFYLIRYRSKEEQNFTMVSRLLSEAKADKNGNSKLDNLFNRIRDIDPDDICVRQYDIFKQASDKTAQSILITAAVRLAPFNIDAVSNLTTEDQMHLQTLGDRKSAVFIIVPQGDNTYSFLVNMMYSQMFSTLYEHAAKTNRFPLPVPVRFILDEFANIGVIPNFQQKLTTMRKYGLSCMIFIQAIGQIKNLYKDDWETIKGACMVQLYLGGNETSTHEEIVKMAGKETIRTKSVGQSSSGKGTGSDSRNYQYTGRDLITLDEVRRLRPGWAICMIAGQQPLYEERYPTQNHPNAKYLGDLKTHGNLYEFNYCNAKSSSVKRLEENRKKLAEKRKELQKSRVPNARPISSPKELNREEMEKLRGNPEEVKKTAAQMPVTTGVNENAAKESDATVIQNTGPNWFRETTYGRPGGLYRASFPPKINPMPASEEAKRHEAESLNRASQSAADMNLTDLLSACEQISNKRNGT